MSLQIPQFSVENVVLDPSGHVYVKYPIGNVNYKNKYDWKFTRHTDQLFSLLDSNLGHPLVLSFHNGKFGHPIVALAGDKLDDIYSKNEEFQKPFLIGINDKVYREIDAQGFVYGRYDITDPRAQAFYRDYYSAVKNGFIPNYNSIGLVFDKDETNRDGIHKGKILHNALVSEPAWGLDSKIKGICIGEDKKCDEVLAYAGNLPCVVCPEKQQQVFDFLSLMKSYLDGAPSMFEPNRFNILFAGEKSDMSTQQETKDAPPKTDDKKTDTVTNDALNNLKKEMKDDLRQQIDDALAGVKAQTNPEPPKTDEKKTEGNNIDYEKIIADKIKAVEDRFEAKVKDLQSTIKTQKDKIDTFEKNENDSEIGRELLNYKEIFKGKDGKVDVELFNNTLKYYADKNLPLESLKKDFDNSFKLAINYIANYTPEVAKPTKTEEKKPEPDTRDRREKLIEEYENEKSKIETLKAGNDSEMDDIDSQAQDILRSRRSLHKENEKAWNGGLVY